MLDKERCRRIIAEAFPEVEARSVRYFAAGWDCELWEVNEEILFRFPLRPECAEPLRMEARLLAALAEGLSVAVPRPEYVSDGCAAFPLPFFGYRKLAGVPLAEAKLSADASAAVAGELGRFLTELHSFPAARAAELGVPAYSTEAWRDHYVRFYAKIRSRVLPLLQPDEAQAVESFWRSLLGDVGFFRFDPVLIHRDLGDAHILVHKDRLVGVIDFGDACVGDPALDFAGREGALRTRMLATYRRSREESDRLSPRADLYSRISPFHAVLFGLDIVGDEGLVQRGIEAIRARIVAA
jgi:aminoglycoside 2''-phosphotransferase